MPESSPLIWDAHSCVPLHPAVDLSILHKHRLSGAHFVSINVGMDFNPVGQIMMVLGSFRAQVLADPLLCLVDQSIDIVAAKREGMLGVAFDLEGSVPLLDQPSMVELYWSLGVRQIHLAYNRNNSIAGGCHDTEQGLTKLGHTMVTEVNRVGMLLDVSHNSYQTSMDIFAASSKPVIYSHANPKALIDHRRNIRDEQIKACAATGGVICTNGVERFLGSLSVDAFLDHLCYTAELVGAEHVGIGIDTCATQQGINDDPADFDPLYWWPPEDYPRGFSQLSYLQPEHIPEIANGLVKRGFSSSEQTAILGGNMMRVASQCWDQHDSNQSVVFD